jgi:hypothetical protein
MPMATLPDFSNLAAYAVNAETTAEYVFIDIEGEPSIICAPAVETNLPYYNESLRLTVEQSEADRKKLTKRGRRAVLTEIDADDMEEARDKDRRVIAMFCARSWGTAPVDAQGNAVEFSAEICLAYLRALPFYIFDPMRRWVTNPRNFVQKGKLEPGAGAALGEDLPSA